MLSDQETLELAQRARKENGRRSEGWRVRSGP